MSKVKRVSTLPWREKMREANIFSEKFLELSLWRALAEEPLHANFAQEKVMGHTAATCKEHSEQNLTHISLRVPNQ